MADAQVHPTATSAGCLLLVVGDGLKKMVATKTCLKIEISKKVANFGVILFDVEVMLGTALGLLGNVPLNFPMLLLHNL